MKKNKTKLATLGLVTGLLLVGCQQDSADEIVMSVGDQELTAQEFYEEMRDSPYSGEFTFGEVILEQEMVKSMLTDKYGDDISEETIAEKFEEMKAGYGDEEDFKEALEADELTEEDLKEDIKMSLLIVEGFKEYLPIEEEDLKAAYEEMIPKGTIVRHVFTNNIEEAESAKAELEDGEDFADVVKKYSIDEGSVDSGGEYELVRGEFVPEFEKTALELEVDETSDIVESELGYHIINLKEKGEKESYEDSKDELEEEMYESMRFEEPESYEKVMYEVFSEYKDDITIHDESITNLVDRLLDSITPVEEREAEEEGEEIDEDDIEVEIHEDELDDTEVDDTEVEVEVEENKESEEE